MLIRAKSVLGIKDLDGNSPIYPGTCAEVDESTGKRLVEIGVAEETGRPAAVGTIHQAPTQVPSENPPAIPNAQNELSEGENDELESMSFNELKALAKEMGIETGKIKSKAGMIQAIHEAGAADQPPVFEAQEVVEG
jgi:hypothetical protein